ncbi:MAG TPA: ABC transporter ATP-binding protein [Acidimicrobiales bacterium]|nr:ABC transporter ATP-binding protein [Acidimicrobiales bacterium]
MTIDASSVAAGGRVARAGEGELAPPILEVHGISKTFTTNNREVVALRDVSLAVRRGEFVSLVGASGCGKTTLLRSIVGLESPDAGIISLEGQILDGVSKDMAYVFQDINLLPWRSVVANVELGLEARAVPKRERRERAMHFLGLVGLTDVADAPPYTLSGGMQQRVGVARALATEPKVLLMDEPFGQLDNFTREALQVEISNLWSRLGTTIVFVTHDVDEAIFLSDRVVLFVPNPGRISEIVDVPLPRPRSDYDVRADSRAIELRSQVMQHLHRAGAVAG